MPVALMAVRYTLIIIRCLHEAIVAAIGRATDRGAATIAPCKHATEHVMNVVTKNSKCQQNWKEC